MSAAEPAIRILAVDDDPGLLDLIGIRLTSAGYEVTLAASGFEAIECFQRLRPRVVVTDLRMDGMDGHALFERLHAEAPSVPVIILTAHGTIPDAVAATQRGVFGFLTKPFDGRELLDRVAAAVAVSPPIEAAREDGAWRKDIISAAPAMEEVLRNARRLADGNAPLLLTGPGGCGKKLLAQAIHATGTLCKKPFHVLRCGSVDTGSTASALADALAAVRDGTLLLEDVGQLDIADQSRLLPLIGDGNLFGGNARKTRIIASSVQSLEDAVRSGSFRADLYYGLARHALALPPLAERRADIPLLVAHFSAAWTRQFAGVRRGFAPDALALLCEAPWPGNVRQLRSLVQQALAQATTAQVPAALVRRLLSEGNEREMTAFDEARRSFEHDYLVRLLKSTAGNVTQAARIAQRNRTEFYKLLARHAIDPTSFKP